MAGWHHRLNGCESEWTLEVGDGQGGLGCCDSWGHNSRTQLSDWTELNRALPYYWLQQGPSKLSQLSVILFAIVFMQLMLRVLLSRVRLFVTPWTVAHLAPGKNTGVGCHSLLQGILLTQGLNLHLLHWQADSFPPSTWRTPCEVCSEVKTSVIVIQEKHLNSKALSRRSIKVEKVLLRLKCFQI